MEDEDKLKIGLGCTGMLAILMLPLMLGSCTTVDPGNTGVLVNLGEIQPDYLSEGFHWKKPFIDDIVEVDTRVRKHQIEASAGDPLLQR